MGNTESAKVKRQQKKFLRQMEKESQKINQPKLKNVLLLHKSNATQLRVVSSFRDALIGKTNGTVDAEYCVNIANEKEIPGSRAWLDELNNVVLFCLTSEAIEDFHRIIRENRFADENGFLHVKLFTVSFGEKVCSGWPPKGMKSASTDLRDFYFGFPDVEKIRPQDFTSSLRLNSLIAAIKLTL